MTERLPRTFSDGFCEPILWGVKLGYAIADIAEGCEVDDATVIAVIESRSPVRFPQMPFAVDTTTPRSLDVWERAA